MSIQILTPTRAVDISGDWESEFNALGFNVDGYGAYSVGGGDLVLNMNHGAINLPVNGVPVGVEVELVAFRGVEPLVLDSFTGSAGTLLRNHDGEINADWRKPLIAGNDPSDIKLNGSGLIYYAFENAGGFTNNGAEHFLTEYLPPDANYAVEARFHSVTYGGNTERAEVTARGLVPYRFYALSYRETGSGAAVWELNYANGTPTRTVIATYSGDFIAEGQSRLARLEVYGSSIRGYVDGVLRLSATNATITDNGYPGLRLDANDDRAGSFTVVTAAYDLGSPQTITRFRRRHGTANGNGYFSYLEASSDGVNWVDMYTGAFFPEFGLGTFAWATEIDSTAVDATAYRYWRTVVVDSRDLTSDARIGDFRLYTSGGIVTPGGSVVTRSGHTVGSTGHNWASMTASALFTDNSPGDNTTWVGGPLLPDIANEGLQISDYLVERSLPDTLQVYLTANGATPSGTPKTLLLSPSGATYILGGPLDLWGASWSMSDVASLSFGILFRRSNANALPFIDAARAKIYHTVTGGSFMALRENNKQTILVGRQTALGTSVPATVRLRHTLIQPQPNAEFMDHRPAGEKLTNHQVLLRESSEAPIQGLPTYDEIGWLYQSAVARPATTVLSAGVAYRHVFSLDNRVRDVISPLSIEYGDMFSRAHSVQDLIISAVELAARHDGLDLSGSAFGKPIVDGATLSTGAATVQTITQSGSGTYEIRFRGEPTSALTAGASLTAAAIQTALRALPYVGGSTELTVTGSDGGPFTVTFGNSQAGPFKGLPQPLLEFRVVSGTPTVAIAMTTPGGFIEYPGVPMVPKHFEIFLTPVLANLASSKLATDFVTSFGIANKATPVYTLDRSNPSWTNYAEPGSLDVKYGLMVQANSEGMAFLPQGRSDTILYLRILATGPDIGASGLPHRFQVDCPVKISNFGPFGDNQEIYAFEYELAGVFDPAQNKSLVITLDNGVANYDG